MLIIFPLVKQFIITFMEKLLQWTLSSYSPGDLGGSNLVSLVLDHIMVLLQCCGVNSYKDFSLSSQWMAKKSSMQVIPHSCCITDLDKYPIVEAFDGHCVYVPTKYNSHWSKGCLASTISSLSQHLPIIILIIISVIFLQLFTMITALCLTCVHSNKTEVSRTILVRTPARVDEETG